MSNQPEVVITGMGVVSPIGVGVDAFWESLQAGRSGVRLLHEDSPLPVRIGGRVPEFDLRPFVKQRKSLKTMCREIRAGFAAAAMAMQDAGVAGRVDPDRLGVVFGSELFFSEVGEVEPAASECMADRVFDYDRWGNAAMNGVNPLWLLKYLPNMVTCHIAIAHEARAHNNTITAGETSGLLSMIEAAEVIRRGRADAMICGGTGSRINLTRNMILAGRGLASGDMAPARASRPFDANRNGMVSGEGAAAFLLESRTHAEARGANVLATIAGSGQSCRLSDSDTSAIHRAIQQALSGSAAAEARPGHVNANGLSTLVDDRRESRAIRGCLDDVPVTAPKSYFGNLGAGAGAVETVASLLSIRHRIIPPTLNHDRPSPDCPVEVVREPTTTSARTAVVLNESATGQTAAVLLAAA